MKILKLGKLKPGSRNLHMTHAIYNLAYYYQTMSRAEKIACATHGVVEHYCNNRNITKAYFYADNTAAFYDERLGNAIRYTDLHPQAQGYNFIPVSPMVGPVGVCHISWVLGTCPPKLLGWRLLIPRTAHIYGTRACFLFSILDV